MKRTPEGWKIAAALLAAAGWCGALLTSTSFDVDRLLAGSGGAGDGLTSASFKLHATVGQAGTDELASASFGNGAGYHFQFRTAPPGIPALGPTASEGQFRSDGVTPIATGGYTNETTVVLSGTVSDPDSSVRLEVELEATGTAFGAGTVMPGDLVSSGSVSSVQASGLADGDYHWRGRAEDLQGTFSGYANFDVNAEPGGSDFVVDTTAPTAAVVTAPNGGELIQGGAGSGITWSAAADANLGAGPISIYLSTDGGATFSTLVASGLADSGAYPWTVPAVSTTTARIRIVTEDLAGNTSFDDSDADFAIDDAAPVVAVVAPNGGEFLQGGGSAILQWTTSDANASSVTLLLSVDDGATFPITIASGIADTGSYTWSPVSVLDTASAQICVEATDAAGNPGSDVSDASFTIDSTAPTATATALTSPNGGEVIAGGGSFTIGWTPSDFADANLGATPITLEYSDDGGLTWQLIAANLPNDGSFAWTPPSGTFTNVILRITATDLAGNTVSDVSDLDFKILTPPSGISTIANDGRIDVSWNFVSGASGYKVHYGFSAGTYTGTNAVEGSSPVDAGGFNTLALTGLTNNDTVFLAVSSYDASGTDSAVSIEVTSTPRPSNTFDHNFAQTGGTTPDAYKMVGFPVLPGTPDPLANLSDDLGPYDPTQWRLFAFDNPTQNYVELPDFGSIHIEPGQGFWLITRNDTAIDIQGQLASTDQPTTIVLGPEWNLVGHPFNFAVDFSACLASGTAIGDVGDNGFLQEDLFAWTGTEYVSTTQWANGQSFWVRNIAGEPVTLTIPAIAAKATVTPEGASAKGDVSVSGLAPRRFYAAGQLPPAPPGSVKAAAGGGGSSGGGGGGGGGGGCFVATGWTGIAWPLASGFLAVGGLLLYRNRRRTL